MSTFETPARWRDWSRSDQVNHLSLSHTRADLMSMVREEIGSDRDSDRFDKSEVAHICLKSGVVPCRGSANVSRQMLSVDLLVAGQLCSLSVCFRPS